MPIGAAIGTAAVGIGGAVMGADATRDASRSANDTAQATAAANNALSREMYANNAQRLDPYSQGGLRAGNALQGLLGINTLPANNGAGPAVNPTTAGGSQNFTPEQQWAQGAINAMLPRITRSSVRNQLSTMSNDPVGALNYLMTLSPPSSDQYPLYQQYVSGNPRPAAGAAPAPATGGALGGGQGTQQPGGTPATGGTTPQNGALSAFDTFRNSTNYQWRLGQGQKALEMSGLPGGGYDSGATRKSITEYGQMFAANELGTYMDRLAQQQQLGMGAASALAGVGQNMVGQVTANNNAAGSAAANAALMRGQANSNMWGGIAGSIGQAAGALGSSYGGGGGSAGGWSVMGGT
jgi:hypothetical protein